MSRVQGKVAIVTGAASGLGKATAELLAREGASVVLTDLDKVNGQAAGQAIVDNGGDAVFVEHDVTDEDSWRAVMAAAQSSYGRLDILVNNAGVGGPNDTETLTLADWRRMMSVNMEGVFIGTKLAMPIMAESGGGSIINISSAGGIVGTPGMSAYGASKGGVRLFSKCVALECAQKKNGIRVNSVHPGFIRTATALEITTQAMGMEEAEAVQLLSSMIPLGRPGEPMEIAYGVLYLACDESSYVTGSELVIDGGMIAQ